MSLSCRHGCSLSVIMVVDYCRNMIIHGISVTTRLFVFFGVHTLNVSPSFSFICLFIVFFHNTFFAFVFLSSLFGVLCQYFIHIFSYEPSEYILFLIFFPSRCVGFLSDRVDTNNECTLFYLMISLTNT